MYLDHAADYRPGRLLDAPLQVSAENFGPVAEKDGNIFLPGPGLRNLRLQVAVLQALLRQEILKHPLQQQKEHSKEEVNACVAFH